jgi:site-specific recombinase XerD
MAFLDSLEQRQWAKSTRLQMLRNLRTLFIWTQRDEDCVSAGLKNWRKALPAIQATPRREYIPTRSDLRRWKGFYKTSTFMGHRDYTMFMLLLGTGIRVGEATSLLTDNVMLDEGMMRVSGKTGPRTVTLSGQLVGILRGYLKQASKRTKSKEWAGEVFVTRYGEPCTPNGIGQAFRKHQKRYGLTDITPHTLRHTFCTVYLRGGGSLARLKNMTGHSTLTALQGYVHAAEMGSEESKAELERVNPLAQL